MITILDIVASEFSDLGDVTSLVRVILRLLVAAVLGAALGYERERKGKSAGIKPHMLVALGTCLFIIVAQNSGISQDHMSRVIQGVAQGVGFLGAGSIVSGTAQSNARGLTTAASIWSTAGVGIAAGLGMETTAILSTCCILLILALIPQITKVNSSF